MSVKRVIIQLEPFDIAAEIELLTRTGQNTGAVVTFTGICRDENGRLAALELEHYPGMAETEISEIVDKAVQRSSLDGMTVIHRYGKLKPGDQIVLVVAALRETNSNTRERLCQNNGRHRNDGWSLDRQDSIRPAFP